MSDRGALTPAAGGGGDDTDWVDWLTVGGLTTVSVAAEPAAASTVLELLLSCCANPEAAVCVLLYWEAVGNSTCTGHVLPKGFRISFKTIPAGHGLLLHSAQTLPMVVQVCLVRMPMGDLLPASTPRHAGIPAVLVS